MSYKCGCGEIRMLKNTHAEMMFSGKLIFSGLFLDVFEILWPAAQQQQVVVGFTEASKSRNYVKRSNALKTY